MIDFPLTRMPIETVPSDCLNTKIACIGICLVGPDTVAHLLDESFINRYLSVLTSSEVLLHMFGYIVSLLILFPRVKATRSSSSLLDIGLNGILQMNENNNSISDNNSNSNCKTSNKKSPSTCHANDSTEII